MHGKSLYQHDNRDGDGVEHTGGQCSCGNDLLMHVIRRTIGRGNKTVDRHQYVDSSGQVHDVNASDGFVSRRISDNVLRVCECRAAFFPSLY